MFTLDGLKMGRDKEYPTTPEMDADGNDLLNKVEGFLYDIGIECTDEDINSGYRPGKYNLLAGGSKNSPHIVLQAIDLKKRVRDHIVMRFPRWKEIGSSDRKKLDALLEKHGLCMEHPDYTKTWIHLQTRQTRVRIFIPY